MVSPLDHHPFLIDIKTLTQHFVDYYEISPRLYIAVYMNITVIYMKYSPRDY